MGNKTLSDKELKNILDDFFNTEVIDQFQIDDLYYVHRVPRSKTPLLRTDEKKAKEFFNKLFDTENK